MRHASARPALRLAALAICASVFFAGPGTASAQSQPAADGQTQAQASPQAAGTAAAPAPRPAPARPAGQAIDERYRGCVATIARDPEAAVRAGQAWVTETATFGLDRAPLLARACIARARAAKQEWAPAASGYDEISIAAAPTEPSLAAGAARAAGRLWLLAGDPTRSARAFALATRLAAQDVDIHVDRGLAMLAAGNYIGAVDALNQAASMIEPGDLAAYDVRLGRAMVYRRIGDAGTALTEAEGALSVRPNDPPALLERGRIRALAGDRTGARADWQLVVLLAPATAAGVDAQRLLAGQP